MARPIRGQIVVITGASSGVGRACARAFAARGARLGLIARNREALEVAASEARHRGAEAIVLPLDVTDAEAVERAAADVEEHFGRIDIWINSAMATVFATVMDTTAEEYRRVTEVTYLGYVYGTQAALRRMIPRDEGTIIQIGSALAYRSIPLQGAYCAAKAAIRGFTDTLRTELLHEDSQVKLSMLHLPAINTPQSTRQRNKTDWRSQPVPPMFSPESIADAVIWAAEHTPREMMVGMPVLRAIWAQRLLPGLLDRYLGNTGYQAQLTDVPNDRGQPDILFETQPGDPDTHGPYRDQEREADLQMRLRMTVPGVAVVAAGTAVVALFALSRRQLVHKPRTLYEAMLKKVA